MNRRDTRGCRGRHPGSTQRFAEYRRGDAYRKKILVSYVASVLLLLFSGGHLAETLYTAESLQAPGRGNLVLTMVGLWLVLATVLFFGFRRLTGSQSETSAVAAATRARPWFLGASGVSIALLVVAGLL